MHRTDVLVIGPLEPLLPRPLHVRLGVAARSDSPPELGSFERAPSRKVLRMSTQVRQLRREAPESATRKAG